VFGTSKLEVYKVEKHEIVFHNQRLVDLTSIPGINGNLETSFYDFSLQNSSITKFDEIPEVYKYIEGIYSMDLTQNSKQVHEEWTVTTLDGILAYIGGYTAIVWGTIGALTGWYQQASFDSSFMKSFYTQNEQDIHIESESDDEEEMEATVRNRKPYHHNLKKRFKARLIVLLCCCFKQKPWYARAKKRQQDFMQGMEQLEQEVDLVQMIEMNRFLKFFVSQRFPKHQVQLIAYFQKYCVDEFNSTKLADTSSLKRTSVLMN